MTTKSRNPTPFSRFSRIGLFKSPTSPNNRARTSSKTDESEESWYTPYTGPYEAPRRPYVKPKDRDSWGNSVSGEDVYDQEEKGAAGRFEPSGNLAYVDKISERKSRPRANTASAVITGYTNGTSITQRTPQASYLNINAFGGVGESPSPRTSRDTPATKRTSFASIFGLGSSRRKSLHTIRPAQVAGRQPPGRVPTPTDAADEYYDSYYSSLAHSPRRNQFTDDDRNRASDEPPSSHTLIDRPATTSPTSHPYAYNFPTTDEEHPHTAPLISTNSHDFDPFRSRAIETTLPKGHNTHLLLPDQSSLRISVSSPDLQSSRRAPVSSPQALSMPKGKDRWLSPETWCDALFLPRPRFKVKQDGSINYGKRVVSPPGSPVVTVFNQADSVSRVLAYSRSMVELQPRPDPGSSKHIPDTMPTISLAPKPHRPKSFAFDDLALPSPAPSLSRVLEEGQILEHQRKKWQLQAVNSFQNSRSRSFSRARSKSLTKPDRRKEFKHPHIDFLAARSLLGNQDPIPIITRTTESSHTTSHAHSHSLSKTLTTTTTNKTHSRTHSKNDSWSKSAKRLANGVLCNGSDVASVQEKGGFDDALNADDTWIIRFDDPSASADPGLLARSSPSQASCMSDSRIGIALSTPPPSDREDLHIPSHPYAQGGVYAYSSPAPPPDNHAAQCSSPQHSEERKMDKDYLSPIRVAAHPYALYADRDRDPIQHVAVPLARGERTIPIESTMWARVDEGEPREIRPEEIQYSPYPEPSTPTRRSVRESGNIYDMVGVAEALTNAIRSRASRDSGFEGSDEHPYSNYVAHRQPAEYDATQPLHRRRGDHQEVLTKLSRDASPVLSVDIYPSPSSLRPSPQQHPSIDSDRTPDTSSSQASPRPLGNVDDLENYRDLFYRPAISRKTSTRSQLSTLARQLSEELEDLSQDSDRQMSGNGSASSNGPIQFVFSDDNASSARVLSNRGSILPFHPSLSIPEDIESVLERSPDEDDVEAFRVGEVEYLATPPAVSSAHRESFAGQFDSGQHADSFDEEDITITQNRATSTNLQPPSSDPSRISYTTNSSYSMMSRLSDFPVPPITAETPAQASLMNSYFERAGNTEHHGSPLSRRLTFGGDAEIDELLHHLNHVR